MSSSSDERLAPWRAPLVFAAVALLYTLEGSLPGRLILPLDLKNDLGAWKADPTVRVPVSNRLLSDVVLEYVPWDAEVRRLLRNGEAPWRNRWTADGAPLWANPETALLSPLVWLRLIFGLRAWALVVFLKFLLIGVGAAWLATEIGAKRSEALLTGFVLAACGFTVVWALHTHTNVLAFIPALAAASFRLIRQVTPMRVAIVILLAALATAGGHPETLLTGVVGTAFLVFFVHGHYTRGTLFAAASAATGFLLLSIQLVPFFFLLPDSAVVAIRGSKPVEPFRPVAVVAQILPGFLGTPLRGELDLSGALPMSENFNERSGGFFGAILLVVLLGASRRLPRFLQWGLLVGLIATLFAWRVPGFAHAHRLLPGISLAAPERLILLLVFFAALAAGPAFTVITSGRARPIWSSLLMTAGALLMLAGTAPSLPATRNLVMTASRSGIGLLRTRGLLQQKPEVYEGRLAGYIEAAKTTAFRRYAIPGVAWFLAGFALLRPVRRRKLLLAMICLELVSFGFGFLPSIRAAGLPGVPPPIADVKRLDSGGNWLIAAGPEIYPPNLATEHQLRDIRRYDGIGNLEHLNAIVAAGYDPLTHAFPGNISEENLKRLARLGVRFFLAREAPAGMTRVGGAPPPAVGVYEIAGATRPPAPVNEPPEGFIVGAIITALALVLALALTVLARQQQTDVSEHASTGTP